MANKLAKMMAAEGKKIEGDIDNLQYVATEFEKWQTRFQLGMINIAVFKRE